MFSNVYNVQSLRFCCLLLVHIEELFFYNFAYFFTPCFISLSSTCIAAYFIIYSDSVFIPFVRDPIRNWGFFHMLAPALSNTKP